ncbi:hypothetical protein JCM11641_000181 [Rhodosporidiobolus odoratus]
MPPPSKKSKSTKTASKDNNGRPAKIKKVKEVVFDMEQRKEYLTGFSKRKKAKQTAKRNKAIERERDELRKMRAQIRDQRKEQAAHNVKMAKQMYGDAGETDEEGSGSDAEADSDASGSDSSEHSDSDSPEQAYETADALTTVSVAPLSFSRSPTPELPPAPASKTAPSASSASAASSAQQTSLFKKRVRGTVQARPKLTRKDKKEIVTGGKKVKKQMLHRMKGTKARSAR